MFNVYNIILVILKYLLNICLIYEIQFYSAMCICLQAGNTENEPSDNEEEVEEDSSDDEHTWSKEVKHQHWYVYKEFSKYQTHLNGRDFICDI